MEIKDVSHSVLSRTVGAKGDIWARDNTDNWGCLVAKAALRRKKAFEHQLEQTSSQMLTVEREISSIETANINKETLDAMKNASSAMKGIHGGLTIDKVDQVMEDLREQHAVGEEIAEALTQGAQGQGVDEDELDEELAELQQEQLDERMLKTGNVPVGDQIQRMPAVASGPGKFDTLGNRSRHRGGVLTIMVCSPQQALGRRRRRGGRAAETAGRDGHVSRFVGRSGVLFCSTSGFTSSFLDFW